MSSITDKTNYLKETKEIFKQWILDQQGNITDSTPFREYIDIIDAILTRGPVKPAEWITLDQVNSDNKCKMNIKWDQTYGGLYVWTNANFSNFVPTNPNTYCVICTLTTEEMGDFNLIMVEIDGEKKLLFMNNGSLVPLSEDVDYTIDGSGNDWTITLNNNSTVWINTVDVISGYGESVVSSDILIEKI